VLRGPQGPLYGPNATAGVVNIISAKPKFNYEAKLSGDLGNYNSTRLEGMINIPLVEDAVALRIAGAWTKRDGYVTNQISGNPIDGRDLWSTRVSLRIAPSDAKFDANLIWEHFEENDDRLRSGKQLCKKDRPESLTAPDGTVVPLNLNNGGLGGESATFSQGCQAVSLYSPEAFQTPNGYAIPYYQGLQGIGLPLHSPIIDPYLSTTQSRDLRVIESTVDPDYRANSNIFELQANVDLTDDLTLTSETSYSTDELFSLQDLNRFNTAPGVFANSHLERVNRWPDLDLLTPGPNGGGIFCDPQIGCSDRLVAEDLSTADSTQFSQEFRIGSSFDGPFNFSLGANFLRYDTMDKYYVFIYTIALTVLDPPFAGSDAVRPPYEPGVTDNRDCRQGGHYGWLPPDPSQSLGVSQCIYIDPNPIGSLNDEGHNYFLSKNPYKLISYAAFGEVYYNLTNNLKVTAGLRWTVDKKEAPRIPSMLLADSTIGYTVDHVERQEWREPTGRLALDWKPDLSFTDQTLLYASYAHGYKAGGANPPPTAVITYGGVNSAGRLDNFKLFPPTFDAEFVDAFELGTKNTLDDGKLTLNASAFYYDYKNYQISEIVERSALNRNFDATVWGLELETEWRPVESLRLGFKGGYEKTRIGDGENAIDLMDRTAGDPNYVVARPFPATPSNCVIPTWLATWHNQIFTGVDSWGVCNPISNGLDPVTYLPYVANPTLRSGAGGAAPTSLFSSFGSGQFPAGYWNGYPGYDPTTNNNSTGIAKDLSGNELPNAPNFTATVTADYTVPLPHDWLLSLHSDVHWQSKSYWRVFNDLDYDKLKPFYTVNLAAIFSNEESGWNVMAYVKNVFDEDALTGAFLFSDDTGLTTNVFLTEPRLYGLRVTKNWSGGSLLGTFGARHEGPYPFTVELGGQVQRHDAPYDTLEPTFAPLFSNAIDPTATQHRDLDWGDGREVKVTYAPSAVWDVSAGVRFGKTSGDAHSITSEYAGANCQLLVMAPVNCIRGTKQFTKVYNYADIDATEHEEHVIVDLQVNRDVGFGTLPGGRFRSKAGISLRYAQLESRTATQVRGTPDWVVPPYLFPSFPPSLVTVNAQHTDYGASIAAKREFDGAGPVLSWDMSYGLFGSEDRGWLNIDSVLSGGVLFGKQKADIAGDELAEYFDAQYGIPEFLPPTTSTPTPIDFHRSKSVSVPVAGVSLGLSYKVDRFNIGAGYHWERYFDVLDAGYADHKSYDRTIDGPYFKIAVGFGG
jgi:outer membrane receptor protein involved in Fe transport